MRGDRSRSHATRDGGADSRDGPSINAGRRRAAEAKAPGSTGASRLRGPVSEERSGQRAHRSLGGDRQASQVISSSISSSRAISSSIPASSARISDADASSPPNSPRSTGSKKSIALAPSGRYGRLASQEMDGRAGQAAELDLAGDPLDQLVALLIAPLVGEAHARDRPGDRAGAGDAGRAGRRLGGRREGRLERLVGGGAAHREDHVLDRAATRQLVADRADGDAGRLVEREAADAGAHRRERDAARRGCSRARAIALRTARSMISPFVRRSRSSETAWMTARAASRPAGRHDRLAEGDGRLADGRELDRVAAGSLDLAADARSTSTATGWRRSRSRRPRGRRCRRSRVRSGPTGPPGGQADASRSARPAHRTPGSDGRTSRSRPPRSSWCAIAPPRRRVISSSPWRADQDDLVVDVDRRARERR